MGQGLLQVAQLVLRAGQQQRHLSGGGLGLGVAGEVAPGVLHRAEGRVKGQLLPLTGFFMLSGRRTVFWPGPSATKVVQAEALLPRPQGAPEGQQVLPRLAQAGHLPLVHKTLLQREALRPPAVSGPVQGLAQGGFARRQGIGRRDGLAEPFLQRPADAGHRPHLRERAQGIGGEGQQTLPLSGHGRGPAPLRGRPPDLGEGVRKGPPPGAGDRRVDVPVHPEDHLPGEQRAAGPHLAHQQLPQPRPGGIVGRDLGQLRRLQPAGVEAIRGRRRGVALLGQHRPAAALLRPHPPRRVHHGAVRVQQDQIALAPQHLHHQRGLPHLPRGRTAAEVQPGDALQLRLRDGVQAPPVDVLPQQEQQRRHLVRRARGPGRDEVQAGPLGVRRGVQPAAPPGDLGPLPALGAAPHGVQLEGQAVLVREVRVLHPAPQHRGPQLGADGPDGQGVDVHPALALPLFR